MGKAYANRKKKAERPIGDFYSTPKSLVWCAEDLIRSEIPSGSRILEPCAGVGAVSEELSKMGYSVETNDLFRGGIDYLTNSFNKDFIVTNPPFSEWDNFVTKMKNEAEKVITIGRINYLGTHSRNRDGIWCGLKSVSVFDRYVDFQTPYREDGLFHVGAMGTAWFVFEKGFEGSTELNILNVQPWAKLGGFK